MNAIQPYRRVQVYIVTTTSKPAKISQAFLQQSAKGIRRSWRVRSTLQCQTANHYTDGLLDPQLLILKKIFLCGLTAPSPIFIFSGEGINLTAERSPTNTTHFKEAGKPVGFKHFLSLLFPVWHIPFPWRFKQLSVKPKINSCLLNIWAHLELDPVHRLSEFRLGGRR